MKKIFVITGIILTAFFFLPKVLGRVDAAGLSFNPSTAATAANSQFSVKVNINAGSEQIVSTDIYVVFDGSGLRADSVAAGSYFPTVSNNITTGRVYIAGMVDDPATSKTGSGEVATISFTALKEGSFTISIDCNSSKIVKNDINATNIINCSENGTAAVTVGSGTSGTTAGTTTGGDAGQSTTSLPRSGVFDNVIKWAVPGTILLIMGAVARFIIL